MRTGTAASPTRALLSVLLAILAVFPAGAFAGAAAAANNAEALGPALQQIIEAQRTSIDIPGVSAAVVFADGSRWGGTSGKAILPTAVPVDAETPFVVGSITKTFVAATILRLAEEGRLA